MTDFDLFDAIFADSPKPPAKVSSRTFRSAIEEALIHTYTRSNLETVFTEELRLSWPGDRAATNRRRRRLET